MLIGSKSRCWGRCLRQCSPIAEPTRQRQQICYSIAHPSWCWPDFIQMCLVQERMKTRMKGDDGAICIRHIIWRRQNIGNCNSIIMFAFTWFTIYVWKHGTAESGVMGLCMCLGPPVSTMQRSWMHQGCHSWRVVFDSASVNAFSQGLRGVDRKSKAWPSECH